MTLKEDQRLVCTGQMPLRAPNGTQLAAVPVFKDENGLLKPNKQGLGIGKILDYIGVDY